MAKTISKHGFKGKLFERLVDEMIKKAGFAALRNEEQLTKSKTRFHGRGATHQIDAYGEFVFTIPFVYPLRLLVEAKALSDSAGLGLMRSFSAAVKDISEWYNVDTYKGGSERYKVIGRSRYYDCGAFFSLHGFRKTAEEYAYAQGIVPVTYENNPYITTLYGYFDGLIDNLKFDKIGREFRYELIESIFGSGNFDFNSSNTTPNFRPILNAFQKQLKETNSSIGMISGRYAINVLYTGSYPNFKNLIGPNQVFSNIQEAKLIYENNQFFLRSEQFGFNATLSISKQFITYYLLGVYAGMKFLDYIDIVFVNPGSRWEIIRFKIMNTQEERDEMRKQLRIKYPKPKFGFKKKT